MKTEVVEGGVFPLSRSTHRRGRVCDEVAQNEYERLLEKQNTVLQEQHAALEGLLRSTWRAYWCGLFTGAVAATILVTGVVLKITSSWHWSEVALVAAFDFLVFVVAFMAASSFLKRKKKSS